MQHYNSTLDLFIYKGCEIFSVLDTRQSFINWNNSNNSSAAMLFKMFYVYMIGATHSIKYVTEKMREK